VIKIKDPLVRPPNSRHDYPLEGPSVYHVSGVFSGRDGILARGVERIIRRVRKCNSPGSVLAYAVH
jgi:hypothetical protein